MMTTTYKFNGKIYGNFADLCNAYFTEKGYYPTKPKSVNHKTNEVNY